MSSREAGEGDGRVDAGWRPTVCVRSEGLDTAPTQEACACSLHRIQEVPTLCCFSILVPNSSLIKSEIQINKEGVLRPFGGQHCWALEQRGSAPVVGLCVHHMSMEEQGSLHRVGAADSWGFCFGSNTTIS